MTQFGGQLWSSPPFQNIKVKKESYIKKDLRNKEKFNLQSNVHFVSYNYKHSAVFIMTISSDALK